MNAGFVIGRVGAGGEGKRDSKISSDANGRGIPFNSYLTFDQLGNSLYRVVDLPNTLFALVSDSLCEFLEDMIDIKGVLVEF